MGGDIWQLFNYRELVLIINAVLDFIVYVPFIVGLFLFVNEPLNTISIHAGLNLCYPIVSLNTLFDDFRCF